VEGGADRLAKLGQRSRAYAERWHDPMRIATDLAAVYDQAVRDSAAT
jgi:hypothetical protein